MSLHASVSSDLAETLDALAVAMKSACDVWWIIGSAAIALHGVAPLHVNDVDVVMSEADARRILPHLGLPVRPGKDDGHFRSRIFGRWIVPPLAVEFMIALEVFDGVGWGDILIASREHVHVGGGIIFVPSRFEMAGILRRFGRPKDLDRLRLLNV